MVRRRAHGDGRRRRRDGRRHGRRRRRTVGAGGVAPRMGRRGVCFYTNYESRKGEELRVNPRAALVLHWPSLHRQVRITGSVEQVRRVRVRRVLGQPSAYRAGSARGRRSRARRLRAGRSSRTRSPKSAPGSATTCPRPEFWGGYRVVPEVVEFWLHRDDRLHDRIRYRRRRRRVGDRPPPTLTSPRFGVKNTRRVARFGRQNGRQGSRVVPAGGLTPMRSASSTSITAT